MPFCTFFSGFLIIQVFAYYRNDFRARWPYKIMDICIVSDYNDNIIINLL